MAKISRWSDDFVNHAKEVFLANEHLSLSMIAKQSKELLGQQIDVHRLKKIAKENGDWQVVKKAKYASSSRPSISDEVEQIRQAVFDSIVAAVSGGIFISGDFNEDEVMEAIIDIPGVNIKYIDPAALPLDAVNAYTNLLSRTKTPVTPTGVSAKTEREKAIDLYREVQESLPSPELDS